MERIVLSGIRATGKLHLGNYLGAIKDFVKHELIFIIKKAKWWIIGSFIFFGLNSLKEACDFVNFLYLFLPSFLGFNLAVVIVYYFKGLMSEHGFL